MEFVGKYPQKEANLPVIQGSIPSWLEEVIKQLTEISKDHETRIRSIEKTMSGIIAISGAVLIIIALVQFLMKKG